MSDYQLYGCYGAPPVRQVVTNWLAMSHEGLAVYMAMDINVGIRITRSHDANPILKPDPIAISVLKWRRYPNWIRLSVCKASEHTYCGLSIHCSWSWINLKIINLGFWLKSEALAILDDKGSGSRQSWADVLTWDGVTRMSAVPWCFWSILPSEKESEIDRHFVSLFWIVCLLIFLFLMGCEYC